MPKPAKPSLSQNEVKVLKLKLCHDKESYMHLKFPLLFFMKAAIFVCSWRHSLLIIHVKMNQKGFEK